MASGSTLTMSNSQVTTSGSGANGVFSTGSGSTITNITGNGHTIFYDSSLVANSSLGGKTYTLVNGGELSPNK